LVLYFTLSILLQELCHLIEEQIICQRKISCVVLKTNLIVERVNSNKKCVNY